MKGASTTFGTRVALGADRWTSPFSADVTLRTLDLTVADASISLAPGEYTCYAANATDEVVVGLGVTTATSPPATGGAAVVGVFALNPGMVGSFTLAATTTVHARCVADTANLRLMRKL